MVQSPLFGRRIHISGSIASDLSVATTDEVKRARDFVELLVKELLRRGANFVIPVDTEKCRSDDLPICFDWLIWDTINKNIVSRPAKAPNPLIVAVKHHKNEDQIPDAFIDLWHAMSRSESVRIENVAHWNMNSKRMEAQALHGDILISLGGGEGVLFLANIYHNADKPIIPLTFKLSPANTGSQRLFDFGVSGSFAERFFQTEDQTTSHSWLNKIGVHARKQTADSVRDVIELLESLVPPKAFVIRLLNPDLPDYIDVQNFFDTVVQPVVEGELGYKLVVVDGNQAVKHARIDQDIFNKLHRSHLVIADYTGQRPNCFVELGYALGRGVTTIVTCKSGTDTPFDMHTYSSHRWNTTGTVEERRREFRAHFEAVRKRPPLVQTEPLIP